MLQTAYGWGEGWARDMLHDLVQRGTITRISAQTRGTAVRNGHAPSGGGNRHTFGGLSDAAFRMIPLLEAGRDASWP